MSNLPPWEVGVRQGGDMDIAAMTKNLLDFKEVMDRHDIDFVLFFGTLLGHKREKGFIPWDTDIDVLCFWDQYLNWFKVRDELKELEFNVVEEKPIHDEHIIRDGEKIEIWWCGRIMGRVLYDSRIHFNKDHIFPLKKERFLSCDFYVPNQSFRILDLLYGKNWETPDKSKKGCSYRAT